MLLPIVLLMLLVVVQAGLVVRDEILVVEATREAARAASLDADPAAASRAAARVLPDAVVVVGRRGAVGEPVQVTVSVVSHTDLPVVGALLPDPRLRATATMRVEG